MTSLPNRARVLGVAACLSLSFAIPALAEMEVISSTAPALKTGAILADDAAVDIPDGATVTLMKKPGGAQAVIKGPYKGALSAYMKKDRTWLDRIIGKGGEGTSQGTPHGGTRSIARPPQPAQEQK